MIWVAIANTSSCRIYNYNKPHAQLSLLKEINHPESKMKAADGLTSDKPGRYKVSESGRGTYSPHMDANEVEVDNFSRQIAEELDKGRNTNSYEKLIIITAPHMNGRLHKHLNKHVKALVVNNIQKDIQTMTDRELADFLKVHAEFPDTNNG